MRCLVVGLVDDWVGCGRLVWLSVSCLLGVYGGCCLGFCLCVCVWLLMVLVYVVCTC